MRLSSRTAVEVALTAVGERLAHANEPCSIVVLGGATMNLLGIVDRPTIDVERDLLALKPDDEELEWAAEWVRAQAPSPEFQAVVGKVVAHVQHALH